MNVLLFRSLMLFALLADRWCLAQDLRFQHITTDDGLSDNAITCLYEDHAGYIWIGTERGLNRYDGQRVDDFPPGTTGPMGAHITSIAEDGQGRLWISTADAGLSMRTPSGLFSHFRGDGTDDRSLPSDNLNHVLVLNDSVLVLSTRGHGAIWFHTRNGFMHSVTSPYASTEGAGDTLKHSVPGWCHRSVRVDGNAVWLTMLYGGATQLVNASTGDLIEQVELQEGAVKSLPTNACLVGETMFIGGWMNGVFKKQLDASSPGRELPIDDEVTAMIPWGDGAILAATKVNGLLVFDHDGAVLERYGHSRSDPSSLASDRVTCLLHDRSGNLWVGTANGVSVYAPSVWGFRTISLNDDDRSGNLVFHAIQPEEKYIRIATSKGFILVDPTTGDRRSIELEHDGRPLETTGLFRIAGDDCFIGTETGIFRYDPVHERILEAAETGLWSSFHAESMFQTRALWPSTVGGKDLLLLGALGYGHVAIDRSTAAWVYEWLDYPDQPGTMMLRSTVQDAQSVCWSATLGGVMRWTPIAIGEKSNGVIFSTQAEGQRRLAGNDARSLVLRHDTVWVALCDAGLASIVGDNARSYRPPPHLPHDALGVTLDRAGHVWCTTANGVLRYAPKSDTWLHMRVNDGRTFRQLTKSITTLTDGRIALCADDHLLLFDPAAYDTLPAVPLPTLVSISNTWGTLTAGPNGILELPYRNSAFDAMLTALQPVGVAPLTFLYRLDSEGNAAHSVDASEPARYAGVPVGTHRLLARARDAYGREGPEVVLLTIQVVGPFWQRWWFFVLMLGAGALGMYLFSRFRQKQRLKLQGVRDRIARDLHDDIGSTLGSISFYSEALRRKLAGSNDGMTQDVAEKIGSSSREMIDRMSDIVWSVDPKNDDAGALMERLQTFAKDLLSAKEIVLVYSADADLNERKLSAEQRRNLFLICKEVLYNTVKYADARNVTITISGGSTGLSITIADDGCGFDLENTDSYNGNGLVNMKARADAIHAVLNVTSSPGNGTQVKVQLPMHELVPRSGD